MRKKIKAKHTKLDAFFTVLLIALILYTVLMFGLFLLGINISLKQYLDVETDGNIFGLPNMKWWSLDRQYPNNIFGNFIYAVNNIRLDLYKSYIVGLFTQERVNAPIRADILSSTVNTFIYAGGSALVAAFMPMYMGYLCAMYRNKVAGFLYALVLFVIATPIVGAMPSTINLMRSLRLYNTFIGEFLRRASFTNIYFLIFFAYFRGLSSGYGEAAEIDGASQFSVMFRIYIPLAANIFFTVFLILFVNFWNDFTTPMMYLPSKPTLSYAIYYTTTLDSGSAFNHATRRMAALMVFAIPIILIFSVFNKKLMTNLTMGGMKE